MVHTRIAAQRVVDVAPRLARPNARRGIRVRDTNQGWRVRRQIDQHDVAADSNRAVHASSASRMTVFVTATATSVSGLSHAR